MFPKPATARLGFSAIPLILLAPAVAETPNDAAKPATSAILVKAVEIQKPTATQEIEIPGRLISAERKRLSFPVGGIIEALPAKVGDRAREGDTLARLRTDRFENEVGRAEAALAKARANEKQARANYERIRDLWGAGDISKEEMQKAAALAKGTSQEVAMAGKELAQARLELGDATLSAPADGVIEAVPPKPHEVVGAGETIVVLTDPGHLRFRVHLPPDLAKEAASFSGFRCVFPAMGDRKFPAKLYSRGPSAAEPLRAIPLEVELTGPTKGTALVPGSTGVLRVSVPRGKSSGHPVIPATAMVGDGKGGGEVWVIEPGKKQARKKPVKFGTLRDGMIEITSGLEAGERVITAGQGALTPGCPVRVASAPAASG